MISCFVVFLPVISIPFRRTVSTPLKIPDLVGAGVWWSRMATRGLEAALHISGAPPLVSVQAASYRENTFVLPFRSIKYTS